MLEIWQLFLAFYLLLIYEAEKPDVAKRICAFLCKFSPKSVDKDEVNENIDNIDPMNHC